MFHRYSIQYGSQGYRLHTSCLQVYIAVQSDANNFCLACRWIDDQLDGRPLMPPEGCPERHLAEQAISLSSAIGSTCLEIISADNHAAWSVGQNASQAQIDAFVSACEDLAQVAQRSGGPFLAGTDPGLADIMSWPFIHRALFCAKTFSGFDALATGSGLGDHAKAWIIAMQARAAAELTLADHDLLQQALQSTGRLDWFDYQTAAVDRLHPHLTTPA